MDVLDDQWSQWPVPPETPAETDYLFALDLELNAQWCDALTLDIKKLC